MDAIFLRNLCRIVTASILFILFQYQVSGQTAPLWVPADTAWKGTTSLDWVFRARNGVRIDGDSGYYLPEQKAATRTKYYINDDIPGMLEYLPAGYNDPSNSHKTYPLVIYTPGCGETHNGVFYKHLDGSPNYYYGTGRLFAQGNPPVPDQRWNIGGAQQSYPIAGGTEVWLADLAYKDTLNSGASSIVTNNNSITGTSKSELYQSARQGTGFTYSIPLKRTGSYVVRLHFAETDPSITSAGQRVFDVLFESGGDVINNYDIFQEAGQKRNKAVTREINVGVYDGMLNITFKSDVGLASVSAIEVFQRIGGSFESLPTFIRDGGDYFSQVPLKTLGQKYNALTGSTQGIIVLCLVPRGDPSVCEGASYAPDVKDIDSTLAMAFRNYRVDPAKIYLTGMSQGSTVCFTYPGESLDRAKNIAAVGPVASTLTFKYYEPVAAQRIQNFVAGGVNILDVTNEYDFNTNGNQGLNTHDLNVRAISDINLKKAELGKSNNVVHYFFHDTWQEGNPPAPAHNGWQRAYRGYYPSWDNLPRVFVDQSVSEPYTLFEWFLLQSSAASLPVSLNTFTATRVNTTTVSVDWSTLTESNSRDFTLERSENGINFNEIAKLPAAGNSVTIRKYNYLDKDLPKAQYVYYRLRQTDKDGKFQIFGIRKVFIGNNGFELKAYPTLTTGMLTLEVQGVTSDPIRLRIVDLSGKTLLQQVIAPRQNRLDLNVSHLAKGMYFIQANNNVYQYTTKFIKQ